ncbi:hypothetical protein SynNOUM97013_02794 [Synechococcus sp. NOUM97013]|nr:hypothetical protein SynNOUM97013_02794 [Synechococcus sp. NOUM97013]
MKQASGLLHAEHREASSVITCTLRSCLWIFSGSFSSSSKASSCGSSTLGCHRRIDCRRSIWRS